jgi:REP element-mobilizing transposase RayT
MPPIQQRKNSLRLPNYDYSLPGAYFITLCTQNRLHVFGHISDEEMVLNDYGKVVKEVWKNLPNHYPNMACGEFVVMPNHIHGVMFLKPIDHTKGGFETHPNQKQTRPNQKRTHPNKIHGIPEIVRALKTFSARKINEIRNSPGGKVWQRNYWDRVVRNERALQAINRYIQNNPLKWQLDRLWTQI